MDLRVFKKDDKHVPTTLHAVRKVEYGEGSKLVNPYIKTWCGERLALDNNDTLTKFVKKEHKEKICQACKEGVSLHYRRRERAHYSG